MLQTSANIATDSCKETRCDNGCLVVFSLLPPSRTKLIARPLSQGLRPKINCRTRALALQEIGGTISLGLGDFKLLLLSLRTLVRDKSCHNLYKMIVFWGIVVLGVMVMAMVMLMMVVLVVVPVVTVMVYMVVFVGMVLFLGWQ